MLGLNLLHSDDNWTGDNIDGVCMNMSWSLVGGSGGVVVAKDEGDEYWITFLSLSSLSLNMISVSFASDKWDRKMLCRSNDVFNDDEDANKNDGACFEGRWVEVIVLEDECLHCLWWMFVFLPIQLPIVLISCNN